MSQHPFVVQFALCGVLPVAFGAATGVLLGVSEPWYLVFSLAGVLGGLGAGFDHAGAGAGARRGLLGGSLFGASILIAHELHGADAKAHVPDPAIVLVVVTTILGIALGAAGGALRSRVEAA
jgi:hypothetical protein